MRTLHAVIIAVLVTAIIVGGILYYVLSTTPKPKANLLEIYHWWTSGGEKAAIDALVAVFQEKYPDVGVIQSPVAGGAGYVLKAVMKSMVAAGEAPDSFQIHAGYEMKPYIDGGYLEPIDHLWVQQGWEDVFPAVVKDMVKWGGHYYAVPLNIHRANVLWYNKKILEQYDIDPASLETWEGFFEACERLRNAGITYPIAMGGIGKWEIAHALEQILISQGVDFYQDLVNGKLSDPNDPRLVNAFNIFKRYLDYVNPDYATLTWDQAVAKVIRGESVFTIMGDWANGEFLVANKTFNVDYGAIPVPGTKGVYVLVVDCFQKPKGARHPENSEKWLIVVGSKEGQDAFNPIKGSIPARLDADINKYGPYQRSAIQDFKNAQYMAPSIVHGSGAPEKFASAFNDVASAFASNRNVQEACNGIINAIQAAKNEYVKEWKLIP
uniref:Carbohydrate ABC transporter substrate-binding protein n=1 Tax=Thermosphaera aggregans TaxID=54254 RepID=A0A7C2FXU1_9CREN